MKKCCIVFLALVLGSMSLSGCKGKQPEAVDAEVLPVEAPETEPLEPSPEPEEDLTGKAIDTLTGLYIDEEAAARRPIAVVINNLHKAKPQSGIAQADLIYEVLAEGDITRLVALFKSFDSQKIGPVRSTRDYFLDFALNHDAIFAHHGGSPAGYNAISSLGIDHLDGMADGATFWRDPARANVPGMYEHSSYTDSKGLLTVIEKNIKRPTVYEDAPTPFQFSDTDMTPTGALPASVVTVPYSSTYTRSFVYDKDTSMYLVYQGEEPHIDEETGEQLAVKNILVQLTTMGVISGDDAGRRSVNVVGSGGGYYMTDGMYIPIKWSKTSHNAPMMWTDEAGNPLVMNKGKTWINVHQGDVLVPTSEVEQEQAKVEK